MSVKEYSVWKTDDGSIYGVMFDPLIDNGESTVCVVDVGNVCNITSIKTDTLTVKLAQFYDNDLFVKYLDWLSKIGRK